MSVHKKVGIIGSTSKGMAVAEKKMPLRSSHIRLWIICGTGALLFVAITIGGVWLIHRHHSAGQVSSNHTTSQQNTHTQALGLVLTGHPAAAQQLLDTQIAQAKSAVGEGQLYEEKASLAYSNSDFTGALQYAQKAESLHQTVNSANLIATSAQALGNNTLALQYYKLELQRGGSAMPPTDKLELQLNIKALGG
jgi:hypothetical protein